MAQPPTYTPSIDFSNEETVNSGGRSTVNTTALDTELINIKATLDALNTNIAILQRDDTVLMDLIVTPNSLSEEVKNLFALDAFQFKGDWLTATAYIVGDVVKETSVTYACVVAHTSGTFSVDLAAGFWLDFGDLTASEVKVLYESNANTNEFSDAEESKLAAIEAGATGDQTGAEIKTLYEVETSAFTDAQFTKLSNIEPLADVTDAGNVGAVATLDSDYVNNSVRYKNNVGTMANAVFAASQIMGRNASASDLKNLNATEVRAIINVEDGATADQTNTEIRDAVEAATNSNTFNDADHTKLDNIEALADVTDATNVNNAGAIMYSDLSNASLPYKNTVGTETQITIADNALVGRDASTGDGDVQGLTATEVRALINVEDGSTADQTNTEIRDAVEAATNSNTFNDADHTKLNGIATGAEVNPAVVPQAEAEAGSATTERIWTAQRVNQAIAALAPSGSIPAGTVMLFFQAAAPTGWTEVTTQNDKAVRIVSGTGGGTGGTVAFETAFASRSISGTNTGTAISVAQLPVHSHNVRGNSSGVGVFPLLSGLNASGTDGATTDTGSGSTHTHTFTGDAEDLDVQFINCKLADRD